MTSPAKGPAGGLDAAAMRSDDIATVTRQLGRPPRGDWVVALRCGRGRPMMMRVAPLLEDDSPFPTTFWLTCPHLSEAAGALESAGTAAEWAAEVARDPLLAAAVTAADRDYRAARAALSGGCDPCGGTGFAGQADPLAVKCLHSRVAAALAGIADPIGAAVLERIAAGDGLECSDDRCAPALGGADGRMPEGADGASGARRGGRAGRI